MKVKILLCLLIALIVALVGCGGSSDGGSTPAANGIVKGTVYAPDGATPIAGARIWVPKGSGTDAVTEANSAGDGSFTLTKVPQGTIKINITSGSWNKALTVTVGATEVNLTKDQTTLPKDSGSGAAKIAVVTGYWDHIQYVLRTMGVTDIDIYDGGDGASGETALGTIDDLLGDATKLAKYDIIFVNCGAYPSLDLTDATVKGRIANYVSNGGTLYVTDLAAPVVANVFPDAIQWIGDDGQSGIHVDADVLDATIKANLKSLGVLDASDKLPIDGFLGGWCVMKSVASTTKVIAQGSVTYYTAAMGSVADHRKAMPSTRGETTDIRPLTVTFTYGKGEVVYSSYHTHEGAALPTLTPQEHLLGLLAFKY